MPDYLPLGRGNDDSTDRMLLSGMGYCWWGERGNIYARVQRLAAHLNGQPVPDTPALSQWDRVQAATAAAVRGRPAAGRTTTACACSQRLDRELAYVLHGLDSASAGSNGDGSLAGALDKEIVLWHAAPSLRATMIANMPDTRLALRRLLSAVMQPGAAQDIMLRAFCRGHVKCQGATAGLATPPARATQARATQKGRES
jgi:hypothetical protein